MAINSQLPLLTALLDGIPQPGDDDGVLRAQFDVTQGLLRAFWRLDGKKAVQRGAVEPPRTRGAPKLGSIWRSGRSERELEARVHLAVLSAQLPVNRAAALLVAAIPQRHCKGRMAMVIAIISCIQSYLGFRDRTPRALTAFANCSSNFAGNFSEEPNGLVD